MAIFAVAGGAFARVALHLIAPGGVLAFLAPECEREHLRRDRQDAVRAYGPAALRNPTAKGLDIAFVHLGDLAVADRR